MPIREKGISAESAKSLIAANRGLQPADGVRTEHSQPSPRRPYTFDRVVRMVITLVIAGFSIWLIDRLSGVLLPFLVAWLIAYLLEPFVQQNRRWLHLKGRFVAILLTLLEAGALFVALGIIFVPSIIAEIHQVGNIFAQYANSNPDIPLIPAEVHEFLHRNLNLRGWSEQLTRQDFQSIAESALGLVYNGIDFLVGLFGWLIVVLYVIFIMLDYERLVVGIRRLVPPRYRPVVYGIWDDVQTNMNLYFRGQALVSLIVGVIFAIGFSIVGLPLGVVFGLFIGVLNMVPYLQLISLLPCAFLCLVYSVGGHGDFWTIFWECMAIYCICQAIQDLILTPKIMGKYMGLNPAVILLSLSVWGSLLGFIGLIIALPLTTLLLSYYNRYIIVGGARRIGLKTAGDNNPDADSGDNPEP